MATEKQTDAKTLQRFKANGEAGIDALNSTIADYIAFAGARNPLKGGKEPSSGHGL